MTKSDDYGRVAQLIEHLSEHYQEQPGLEELAQRAGLSPYHLQRLFRRWAGISPKRFVQFLTLEHARTQLRRSQSLLEVAWDAGLSGPGRLHDLFVHADALSPGEARRGGEGLRLRWGAHSSPFGRCAVGLSDKGIVALSFRGDDTADGDLTALQSRVPRARWVRDPRSSRDVLERIFAPAQGPAGGGPLLLHLRGTNFQLKVWEALLRIPPGAVATYGQLARVVGRPRGAQAVGQAVGANPIAYVIPCHRVIRATGHFGDYHWGHVRKQAMLGWEAAQGDMRPSGDA